MARENTESAEYVRTFARNLEAARNVRGLSQRQLARLTGISGAAVSRYESADHESAISLPLVMRLARVLRVHLAWLLLNEGPRDLDAPVIVLQIDTMTPDRLRELADQLECGLGIG